MQECGYAEDMADTALADEIRFLYPDAPAEVLHQVEALLADFKRRRLPEPAPDPFFRQEDAILICYPDHVRRAGEPALRTLRRFLNERAKGLVSGTHILPFYPYSSDDGFSVIDYRQVGDGLGDWSDVEALSGDFQLMVDLVINHASAQSAWFQGFLEGNSALRNWFIAFDRPVDVSSVFRPRTHPLLTPFETRGGTRYVWTTFSADQIDVNFADPDVMLEYLSILLFYIEHGARIIRLDAIAYLWKELGTSSLHLPQVHAFVRLLRRVLEDAAPSVWIITETNVPHVDNIAYFGNGVNEAHLVYNFALPPLLLYSIQRGDATILTRWAQTLTVPSGRTAFFNFTASHDGIGVTALREFVTPQEFGAVCDWVRQHGGRVSMRDVPGREPVPYELNITFLDAAGSVESFIMSQALMLSLQGVPGIYFGSFVGAENWSEGVERLGYNRAINREKLDYDLLTRELDAPDTTKHRVYEAYARLLRARRSESLFRPDLPQVALDLDPRVFAVLREAEGERLLAVSNVDDAPVTLSSGALSRQLGSAARDILSGSTWTAGDDLALAPYGVAWLRAQ